MDIPEDQNWMMQLAVSIINDDKIDIPDSLELNKILEFMEFCKEYEMMKILGPQGASWAAKLTSGTFQTVWIHMELGDYEGFRTQFGHLFVGTHCVAGNLVDETGRGPNDYQSSLPECFIDAIKFGRIDMVKRITMLVKRFIDKTNNNSTACHCDEADRAGCRNARIGHALRVAMDAGIATAVFAPENRALEEYQGYQGSIGDLVARTQATGVYESTSVTVHTPFLGAVQAQNCMWLDDALKEAEDILLSLDLGDDGERMWEIMREKRVPVDTWSNDWRAAEEEMSQ
ncbi:hypothetical protein F5X68DRAFT_243852 [Plectosphaerella plurivora]|uniref:Uncharacterized protein n=1 Tax=Plectosphaerella plurivora TaxID=936078 RepID=A0A9P8VJW3_9PEZI|nr:hypothetical protein F5X68DRAFT_243852 [Plectosphaerella plurivora]